MDKVLIDYTKLAGESALHTMLDYSTDKLESASRTVLGNIFKLLYIQP